MKVSIIIPLFNGEGNLKDLMLRLADQSFPLEEIELILVDNGSTDDSYALAKSIAAKMHMDVKILQELDCQSSYSARNCGLRIAKGAIIAFTDSDCRPQSDWVRRGVEALNDPKISLVAGEVTFYFRSFRPTASEAIDSSRNMQIEEGVLHRKIGKTANLFVRREVFDEIGLFPSEIRSGGDVFWTRKAVEAGFEIAFSKEAEVQHPARTFSDLLKKQIRVGHGQVQIQIEEGKSRLQCLPMLIANARRPPSRLVEKPVTNTDPYWFTFRLMMVSTSLKIGSRVGRLLGVIGISPPPTW